MNKEYTSTFRQMREVYLECIAPNDISSRALNEQMEQVYEYKKNTLDPVDHEDEDIDNDGDEDEQDEYLLNRRKVRSKKIKNKEDEGEEENDEDDDDEDDEDKPKHKKSKKINERLDFVAEFDGYYNWRDTVSEDIQAAVDELSSDRIEEKPVNNYIKGKKGKPIVQINPSVAISEAIEELGGEVLFLKEDAEYLNDAIELATDYFYTVGLNENGVFDVIDSVGEEVFSEWVMGIVDHLLINEARTLTGKKKTPATGKERSISLKAAPGKTTKAAVKEYGTTRKFSFNPKDTVKKELIQSKIDAAAEKAKQSKKNSLPPGQQRIVNAAKSAVQSATSPEGRQAIGGAIRSGLSGLGNIFSRGALSAWEGHKAAMQKKKQGGSLTQQLGSGVASAFKAHHKKGTEHFKEWLDYLLDEGYDISDWTIDELYEKYETLEEKAVSEQQQKLFGLALSVKRGETSRSKASPEVLEIVDTMSEKKIRDFAKTKHEDVPKKIDEGLTFDDIVYFMIRE